MIRVLTTFSFVYPQLDLMGQSVYEFSHPCDHDEVRDTLNSTEDDNERVFFMRFKCTLTRKGRNVNLKSATYKVNWIYLLQ